MNESTILEDQQLHFHTQEWIKNCSLADLNSTYFIENCGQSQSPGHPWWIHLIVQILYGIVCCVGLCGNTLVIYVVVRFSKMQTGTITFYFILLKWPLLIKFVSNLVTNLYIVNLAIADEVFHLNNLLVFLKQFYCLYSVFLLAFLSWWLR